MLYNKSINQRFLKPIGSCDDRARQQKRDEDSLKKINKRKKYGAARR